MFEKETQPYANCRSLKVYGDEKRKSGVKFMLRDGLFVGVKFT